MRQLNKLKTRDYQTFPTVFCKAGQFWSYSTYTCTVCGENKISGDGATECQSCPAGVSSNMDHTKCGNNITKCGNYITKCVNYITKCGNYIIFSLSVCLSFCLYVCFT